MRKPHLVSIFVSLAAAFAITACSSSDGSAGGPGAPGATGGDGARGAPGPAGSAAPPGASSPSPQVAALALPGPAFYPESIHAAADGTLFAGSIGTGEIVKFAPGADKPQVIVPPATPPVVIAGLFADDSTGSLFVCANHFAGPGFSNVTAELRSYDFAGKLKKSYALPRAGGMCEDMALDAKHNVYVTDAFLGAVYVLRDGASALVPWASSDLLKPSPTGLGFGAHGVAFDGKGNLFVNNFDRGSLVRIPITSEGTAGPLAPITVTPALESPEALRMVNSETFVVVEDLPADGRLTQLTLTGADGAKATTMRNKLLGPTSVVLSKGSFWISEGQVTHLLDPKAGPPSLPFVIERQIAE